MSLKKEFINMCESSDKIQAILKRIQSKVYSKTKKLDGIVIDLNFGNADRKVQFYITQNAEWHIEEEWFKYEELILIPSFEQIAQLIEPDVVKIYVPYTTIDTSLDFNRSLAIHKWFEELSKKRDEYANTLMTFDVNQLWLAFYMYMYEHKKWDENKQGWVLINK